MEIIVLKAGDQFYQKWSGLQKPMKFDVLSIHGNLIDIECHAYNGKHFTETWTLESTIKGIELGVYILIK